MSSRTVVNLGLLIAISVILTRFFSVMIPIGGALGLRLSVGEIPIFLAGILFGPLAGAASGIAADVIGISIAGFDFFPGFTLTAALTGFVPGVLLHSKRRSLGFLQVIIGLAVTGILATALNTLWVNLLYGQALVVLLPPRILARAVMIPMHSIIVWTLIKRFRLIHRSA